MGSANYAERLAGRFAVKEAVLKRLAREERGSCGRTLRRCRAPPEARRPPARQAVRWAKWKGGGQVLCPSPTMAEGDRVRHNRKVRGCEGMKWRRRDRWPTWTKRDPALRHSRPRADENAGGPAPTGSSASSRTRWGRPRRRPSRSSAAGQQRRGRHGDRPSPPQSRVYVEVFLLGERRISRGRPDPGRDPQEARPRGPRHPDTEGVEDLRSYLEEVHLCVDAILGPATPPRWPASCGRWWK
jgi:hypothetical protein